jgi:hypothetical protein
MIKKQNKKTFIWLTTAAFSIILTGCSNPSGADNKNVNINAVPPVANTNLTMPAANSNTNATVENSNLGATNSNSNGKTSEGNSGAAKSGEKLAQRIIGVWEGKGPTGQKVGLDFRSDGKVYPVGGTKAEEPAPYKIIDEENAELTTPDAKAEIFKIKVEGNKMTVSADGGKIELTKAN